MRELGKRLRAWSQFEWLEGMRDSGGDLVVKVLEGKPVWCDGQEVSGRDDNGSYPDLSHAGTRGLILELIREKKRDPTIWLESNGGDMTDWAAYGAGGEGLKRLAVGVSEADVLVELAESCDEWRAQRHKLYEASSQPTSDQVDALKHYADSIMEKAKDALSGNSVEGEE